METKTIRTPIFPTLCFLALLLIPIVFFSIGRASASTLREQYCENQYQQSFVYKISPLAYSRCKVIFERRTNAWITGDYSNY